LHVSVVPLSEILLPQKMLFTAHIINNRWVGTTFKMDMGHMKKTIDSGRVCSPHVVTLMRGPDL